MTTSVFRYRGASPFPTTSGLKSAARSLGIGIEALEAVIDVEAAGEWYKPDGSFVRRFEPHHVPAHIQRAIGFSGNWRTSLGLRTSTRRRMFAEAYSMDPEAACYAASWGAFQIMGFNAKRCGYDSAVAMCRAFEKDVDEQLRAFVRFVKFIGADGDLRAQDWTGFARKYNGSGQPHVYGRKIERAYLLRNGRGSPTILKYGARGDNVVELQRALASRGFEVEVDGHFGAETLEGVRSYQKANQLVVDGMVGAKTWEALRADARYAPGPEPDETPGDAALDKVTKASGALTAITGAATPALTGILGDNPSDTVRLALLGLVGLLATIAVVAYLLRSRNRSHRAANLMGA